MTASFKKTREVSTTLVQTAQRDVPDVGVTVDTATDAPVDTIAVDIMVQTKIGDNLRIVVPSSHADLSSHLNHGYELADVSLGDSLCLDSNMLHVDFSYCSQVLENREMSLAVEKRFKNKRTAYGVPGYKELVAWCLASDSFNVREEVLDCVSNNDIELVWQFIDTMSVSSSPVCRELVMRGKGSRNSSAFTRTLGRPASPRVRRAHIPRGLRPPVLEDCSDEPTEEHRTIDDIMAEDFVSLIRGSDDPLCSVESLRLKFLKGN